jgi:ribonuclease HI
MTWTIQTDGGSRGNPGPAGAGVLIRDAGGHEVLAAGFFLGRKTNNEAEYEALLRGLSLLTAAGARKVKVLTDSELMAHQINGIYRVKAPDLKPLFDQAQGLLCRFEDWQVEHVPRERNRQPDQLANRAMDAKGTVVAVDRLGLIEPNQTPGPPPAARDHRRREASPGAVPARGAGIEVHVAKAPRKGTCKAAMKEGQTFLFVDTTPAGLCLDACAAVMEAVLAVRDAVADGVACDSAMSCRCSQPDCGAVFEIRHLD